MSITLKHRQAGWSCPWPATARLQFRFKGRRQISLPLRGALRLLDSHLCRCAGDRAGTSSCRRASRRRWSRRRTGSEEPQALRGIYRAVDEASFSRFHYSAVLWLNPLREPVSAAAGASAALQALPVLALCFSNSIPQCSRGSRSAGTGSWDLAMKFFSSSKSQSSSRRGQAWVV